jgi:hypothetical protein
VIGYCALVLATRPRATVERLLLPGLDIKPIPGDILTIVDR